MPRYRGPIVVLLSLAGASCHGHPAAPGPGVPFPDPNADAEDVEEWLVPTNGGRTVFDRVNGVTWLADANLAADPIMRELLHVTGVGADGTMDYEAAVKWVKALNSFGANGYLGHRDWQLPITHARDATCYIPSGRSENSYGPGCRGSALGALYAGGFHDSYPAGLIAASDHRVGPFHDLQQGLYWTADDDEVADSVPAYSFTGRAHSSNTTLANFFPVLPVAGPDGAGTGSDEHELVPYTTGPAAGLALRDSADGLVWPLDGALAARESFGLHGTVDVAFHRDHTLTLPEPVIDGDGKLRYAAVEAWLLAMNQRAFAGFTDWRLPTRPHLDGLYDALALADDPTVLLEHGAAGPFRNVQLYFYWTCVAKDAGRRAACDYAGSPGGAGGDPNAAPMQWDFNFQSGFQGTAIHTKKFFVMVYYPHA